MSKGILSVHSLTKSYENKMILNKISFHINRGQIYALIGKNGIGKTVLLKCILGFESFDEGSVLINGHKLDDREYIRKVTAYIPSDGYNFYEYLTPNEYLSFITSIYNLSKDKTVKKIAELSERLGITSYRYQIMKELSYGTKKKVLLLGSLLFDPLLLVCDEIFEGIDQPSVNQIILLFKEFIEKGNSVLFSTHQHYLVNSVTTSIYEIENTQIFQKGKM